MFQRRIAWLAILAVLGLVGGGAIPAHALTTPTPSTSCVDLDNNGICNANDPALAPLLDDGFFDTTVAFGDYVPPGGAIGIIVNNLTTTADQLTLYATGNIRLAGKIKATAVESVDIETPTDMFVGAGASLAFGRSRCCLSDFTVVARNLTIGAKAQLKIAGDESSWDVEAKNIDIGDRAKFTAQGSDADLALTASNRLTFGLGDEFKAPSTGVVELYSEQSMTATGLRVTAGDIDIEAQPPDSGHIPGRVITLTNSFLLQSSRDGSLTLYAGDPFDPAGSDEIIFVNTIVKARSGFTDIQPTPVSG